MEPKTQTKNIREDLVHKELCFKIVGILLEVYNTLGYGYAEKVYQKAIAAALKAAGLNFVEQLYMPVIFQGKVVGKNYFDFLIEGTVVLEIKKGDYFSNIHIKQVYQYLLSKNLELGILAYFAPRALKWKRIVNLKDASLKN